jgi:hypothetical protein
MLDRAKFLVVSEITEVMGEKVAEIESKVEKALEHCFATKAKNAAKAKPAPAPVPVKAAVAPKAVAAAATPIARVSSKVTPRRSARAS